MTEFKNDKSQTKISKRKFTPVEDELIKGYVNQYGSSDFSLLLSKLNSRTLPQVRDRWRLYLNTDVKKDEFSDEEDNILKEKYVELKGKWSQIAKCIPGRTDVQVKFRFQVLQRKRDSHIFYPVQSKSNLHQPIHSFISHDNAMFSKSLNNLDLSPKLVQAVQDVIEDNLNDKTETNFDAFDWVKENFEPPTEFEIFSFDSCEYEYE
jgi:hypothetical protein